jgi:exodeoxyribonuclease III
MKLISWNVNGLRAVHKKGKLDELFALDADIIGIQETKCTPDQLPEEVVYPKGYISFFDSAKERKGYSGVAVYTKEKPEKVEYGLGKDEYDIEGRCLTLHFKDFAFVTCYFPNGGRDEEHFRFKLRYYEEFLRHVKRLEDEYGKVIFCGDLNVAHAEIDIARPKENANSIGFLPVERSWVDRVQEAGFIDTFRALQPGVVKYSWWDMKTRSRERDIGWRIDYFFVNEEIFPHVRKADILTAADGSDHAPVLLEVNL